MDPPSPAPASASASVYPRPHDVFQSIPYQSVHGKGDKSAGEHFQLFQFGVYNVDKPIFAGLKQMNMNEIAAEAPVQETVELVSLDPNSRYSPHMHRRSAAVIYIVQGSGTLLLGSDRLAYSAPRRFCIPANTYHGFETKDSTLFLSIQSPPIIDEQTKEIDIVYQGQIDENRAMFGERIQNEIKQQNIPVEMEQIESKKSNEKKEEQGNTAEIPTGSNSSQAPERVIRVNDRSIPQQSQGIPGNLGLDHVGLTVPNVEYAMQFLMECFDAEFDWEVIRAERPTFGERGWDSVFHVHPDTVMPRVVMLKCGSHALTQYVELFEFRSPDQSVNPTNAWPKFSHVGHSYLSFTVQDLDAVLDHLKQKIFPKYPGTGLIQPEPMEFPLRGDVCRSLFISTVWGGWIEITCWAKGKSLGKLIPCQETNERSSKWIGSSVDQLPTPSLVIDLDRVDRNIKTFLSKIEPHGVKWCAPVKALKCPSFAHYLTKHGCDSILTMTLAEAEEFAKAGCKRIYLSNQVAGSAELRRLSLVAKQVERLRVSVDDFGYLDELVDAVRGWEIPTPIEVLVEININHNRMGLGVDAAVQLAKRVIEREKSTGAVKFAGITGYEGHTPILPPDEKLKQTTISHSILRQVQKALVSEGIDIPMVVSGGASCNYTEVLAQGPIINEIQAGGFALCDALYYEKANLKHHNHEIAIFVVSQVISAPTDDPQRATVNAGFKAVGWHPMGGMPQILNRPDVICSGLSAEHARLRGVDSATGNNCPINLTRGDRVRLVPGYTDAAGSYHRTVFAYRSSTGTIESEWPTVSAAAWNNEK